MFAFRKYRPRAWSYVTAAMVLCLATLAPTAHAGSAAAIDKAADEVLQALLDNNAAAEKLAPDAAAILIFPNIGSGALIVGGQYGEGVLRRGGDSVGYYNIAAASIGLQVGGQKFAYVMMFLDEGALEYLDTASGWEVGTGPSVVAADAGAATSLTTATHDEDVYTFTFDQEGLMVAAALQGSKISKIQPDP